MISCNFFLITSVVEKCLEYDATIYRRITEVPWEIKRIVDENVAPPRSLGQNVVEDDSSWLLTAHVRFACERLTTKVIVKMK